MIDQNQNLRLGSWKEIAAHLGVTVRTAQKWERDRGLPVHRLPGARGRVWADAAAINEWRAAAAAASANGDEPRPGLTRIARYALAACLLLGCGFAVRAFWFGRSANPARAAVKGRHLVVFDDSDNEIWRADFPSLHDVAPGQTIWVGDLNGDGDNEVLFASLPDPNSASTVICYSRNGRERWRFHPGRSIRAQGEDVQGPFIAVKLLVDRFGRGGEMRVIVSSQHYLYFPCQIAMLDANGAVLREYWHAGHLPALWAFRSGGRLQLLAGGVSNARKGATLVVLDPETMAGAAAEENPNYRLEPFDPGKEVARIFFPRSPIAEVLRILPSVWSVWGESPGFVAVEANAAGHDAGVDYHFRPDLSLARVWTSTAYEELHRKLESEGKLRHPLDSSELSGLGAIERAP